MNRPVETAHVQIPLGKGNLYIRLPESPVNTQVNLGYCNQPLITILNPDVKFEIERALSETQKQHSGSGRLSRRWALLAARGQRINQQGEVGSIATHADV